jgi:hypothetical protein
MMESVRHSAGFPDWPAADGASGSVHAFCGTPEAGSGYAVGLRPASPLPEGGGNPAFGARNATGPEFATVVVANSTRVGAVDGSVSGLPP